MAGLAIGIDLGGTTIAAGLVTAEGEVLGHFREPTHREGPGTALPTVFDLIRRLRETARANGVEVAAIGIGVAGAVDADTGVVTAEAHYVPEVAGLPLAETVAKRVGLPVFVDNDVNVLALGEWMFGAGQGARSLVMLAIGTGVGGGIILDGQLVRGHAGFGGELGHVPINFDGRPCICGGRGCLKTYVSGTDIGQVGSDRLGRQVAAEEVFALAGQGNPVAREIIREACLALGAGIAVIVNGLNPERLLIGGSVARSLKTFEAEIRAAAERYAYRRALAATRLEILTARKEAAVRGGAALIRYETLRRGGTE